MTVQTDLGTAGRHRLGRIVVTDRTLELRMDRRPKQRLVGAGVRGMTGPAAGLGDGQAMMTLCKISRAGLVAGGTKKDLGLGQELRLITTVR